MGRRNQWIGLGAMLTIGVLVVAAVRGDRREDIELPPEMHILRDVPVLSEAFDYTVIGSFPHDVYAVKRLHCDVPFSVMASKLGRGLGPEFGWRLTMACGEFRAVRMPMRSILCESESDFDGTSIVSVQSVRPVSVKRAWLLRLVGRV